MAQPVNLNRARKDKARTEDKTRADRNAVAFARSKAQKTADKAAARRQKTSLDQHKRET